ncbi:MAG: cytochrome c peroxidase [Caulobacteraceae bacterium]
MIRTPGGFAFACIAVVFGAIALTAAARAQHVLREEPITPIPSPSVDAPKAVLGEMLYMDPRLSANGRLSCQSCHDVWTNGATDKRFDPDADGHPFSLNTPTVFNSALSFRLNWEGNLRSLDDLVIVSLHNPKLMGAGGPAALARLKADPATATRFRVIYGRDVDEAGIADAISVYMRSLTTPGARFDRWLMGDAGALSAQELRGYARFKSAGCISCHQGVNVGGNLFQKHGVFHPLAAPLPAILRVPSLRNVAVTGPYFHDGSAPTLRDAVRSMGLAQLDLTLSEHDVDDIVAFLRTLTGEYRGRPLTPAHSQ